jgi:hypothetical protein
MRVFVTKVFARFVRSERISDDKLREAVDRADKGLIDAALGGGLIKQRVARAGQGRSAGFRTVIAFRHGERAVFLYGFAKSARDNIGPSDLERLRKLAAIYLSASIEDLEAWCEDGELKEVI